MTLLRGMRSPNISTCYCWYVAVVHNVGPHRIKAAANNLEWFFIASAFAKCSQDVMCRTRVSSVVQRETVRLPVAETVRRRRSSASEPSSPRWKEQSEL